MSDDNWFDGFEDDEAGDTTAAPIEATSPPPAPAAAPEVAAPDPKPRKPRAKKSPPPAEAHPVVEAKVVAKAEPTPGDDDDDDDDDGGLDIDSLILDTSFEEFRAEADLKTLAVRKPTKQEWFYVHPTFIVDVLILVEEEERTTFFVSHELRDVIGDDAKATRLYFAANRQGGYFWLPVGHGDSGRPNSWLDSARGIVVSARKAWTRMVANTRDGEYRSYKSRIELPEPTWPKMSRKKLIRLGAEGRSITDASHPVIRRLLGET
jgi:hypothetical protein